ncbi:MAG: hypothetical protein MJA27_33435 [Pseudanabaenales cyanobacterium]|nr:hypothetical protein [Pseudanabaenales cyanobacterium]
MSNRVSGWGFWCLSELVAVLAGASVGAMIGLVNESAGIVAAVGTGMAMSFLIGVIARLSGFKGTGWRLAIPIAVGLLAGAVNLALAAVLVPIAIWKVIWPDNGMDWVGIGAVLGASGGIVGGAITGIVLIRLLQRQLLD